MGRSNCNEQHSCLAPHGHCSIREEGRKGKGEVGHGGSNGKVVPGKLLTGAHAFLAGRCTLIQRRDCKCGHKGIERWCSGETASKLRTHTCIQYMLYSVASSGFQGGLRVGAASSLDAFPSRCFNPPSFFAAEIERADLAVATMLSPRGLLKAPILVGIVRAR